MRPNINPADLASLLVMLPPLARPCGGCHGLGGGFWQRRRRSTEGRASPADPTRPGYGSVDEAVGVTPCIDIV